MLTFEQVCNEIKGQSASLLLGNGFSTACDPIFKYDNLKDLVFKKAFEGMDVEQIMLQLDSQPEKVIERIKASFIYAISALHPDWECSEKMKRCADFLKHFSKVYTLNYDLLFYWVINSDPELLGIFKDGFGIKRENRYPNWPNAGATSTFYMHGSLLLCCHKTAQDNNPCPRNPTECMVGKYIRPTPPLGTLPRTLIYCLKGLALQGKYPHFVSEGNHTQKYSRIQKCTYLKGCYDALKSESGNLGPVQ